MTAKPTQNRPAESTEPPHEWQRCSEGFKITESVCSRKVSHRESLELGASSAANTSAVTKLNNQFGRKWIQPELFNSCGRPVSKTRSTACPVSSPNTPRKDTEEEVISWSNSDSDSDNKANPELQMSPTPAKKACIRKCIREKNYSRRTKYHAVQVRPCVRKNESPESDPHDAISASDSDEENLASSQTREQHLFSKSQSPVLQIECTGSPEQQSPPSVDEECVFEIKEPEEEEDAGGTPSIASCASSQANREVSPGQAGLRASEWVKQVKWEVTPSKQASSPDVGDSAKKRKKKFVKGGLAEQMSRILLREKSAVRMWQHQLNPVDAFQGSKGMSVKVRSTETVYSLQMARCTVMSTAPSQEPTSNSREHLVVFSPHSAQHRAALQPGVTVYIFPPWQQLDLPSGHSVLLVTRYHLDRLAPAESSHCPVGKVSSTCVESSPLPKSHGRWMCPCSTDGGMATTRCPAHLFPFVPASLALHAKASTPSQASRPGKTLHTVSCNDGVSRRTLTFDTLLESIEKTGAGDGLLPSFQATVLREFHEQKGAGIVRSLLVEDSQGTVAVICDTDHSTVSPEGRLCCFSCLRVCSRITADRDPALFSAIAGAWVGRVKVETVSQDSLTHISDSCVPSQTGLQSPGFCYLLEVDRLACDALHGEHWLSMSGMQSRDVVPPLVLTTLQQALKNQEQNRRVSVLGKLLHHTVKFPANQNTDQQAVHSNQLRLFITDHSLQSSSSEDHASSAAEHGSALSCGQSSQCGSGLPAYVAVEVRQCCVADSLQPQPAVHTGDSVSVVLLRDLWIHKGVWIADKFSHVARFGAGQMDSALSARVDTDIQNRVMGCGTELPPASSSSLTDSLVSLSGVITGVDEKAAVSWEECDGCGSDQLAARSAVGPLVCLNCHKEVSQPVQRMKMEVAVRCDTDPTVIVNISLQQSTIEEILPDEEDEEGYDVDCVLHKQFGPVSCTITSTSRSDGKFQLTAVQLPA